jgi:hypothetical protein
MVKDKDPEEITLQRVTIRNKERITKYGKIKYGESFNDALGRVLDEYESMKKKRKQE